MKTRKICTKMVKSIVEKVIRVDANSTTCMIVYQPKAPAMLKKFSKVENDK
mgnify:CR=1 FL=1|jgi:cyclic lactone autoinducer peptide